MTFQWPPIDAEVSAAVTRQLHTAISLYDRSGIIARFEDAFAARHNASYALLTSSGTAALHSAYYALGLGPGDEVIVQDYTFFATATPLLQLGTVPVLADIDIHGELDLERADELLTDRTKAVAITHMWGAPQNTRRLRAWCDARGLALVEDCSHAHGATRDGVSVGELADAACWSLQGHKTITAGEGGILTTPHRGVYEKATLLGHFNKRALAEVRTESPLYRFADTGLGLKYRAHPLGLAMAEVYLRRLDDWLLARQRHAARLEHLLAGRAGIGVLTPTGSDRTATFYAFVFTIDPHAAGFTRDDLLHTIQQCGYGEITTCDSMRPLHTYPVFAAPRSPVTIYKTSCIRCELHVAEHLAATSLRINVPADDGPDGCAYIDTAINMLDRALNTLASPPGGTTLPA
ncbi:aminotransferase class V-fold PLP-dependent enzyme [Actinomadura darangshiensis]|uniref:Aminotransferase class V-fold PLP-dependent enzyme n=1 Tax=Actinomadura darangshiensis TaxID=705336 RepID=A0A4R5BRA0_9ACTN|nr:aminotransferase class V-fold PLP-dependent enzyme [Actinomadura darangshiensis]TDD89508.1 aminotransferase class V-fold PLP-dependent enzyme [Actinomadura darangshiensis]